MHLPPDIIEIINSKLESHVCPIYTNSDVQRDKKSVLCVFNKTNSSTKQVTTGLQFLHKNLAPDIVSFEIAKKIYNLSKDEFNNYSTYVKHVKSNKKKNICLDGVELRMNILKEYNNSVEKWLSFMVHKYSNINVPEWFCYLFLPLPETIEKQEYVLIGEIWLFVNEKTIKLTESIIQFIKDNYKNEEFKELLYIVCFGSHEEKKKKTLSFFDGWIIYKYMKDIDHSKFSSQSITNALQINVGNIVAFDWMSEKTVKKLVDCILVSTQIKNIIHDVSVENLMTKAEDHDLIDVLIDYDLSYNTNLMVIDEELDSWIRFNEIIEHYNQESMTVVDDYPIWSSGVCKILDNFSGFDTDDLKALLRDFPFRFDTEDSEDLREYFDRYFLLDNALKDVDLTIRNDSKLCQSYVRYGEYTGPIMEYENIDQYSDLELVVEMMKEMAFLYEKTDYDNIVNKMKRMCVFNSEKAKYIALSLLQQDTNNNQLLIPNRLKNLMKDSLKLKEAYDYWIRMPSWDSLNISDNDSSEYDSDDN